MKHFTFLVVITLLVALTSCEKPVPANNPEPATVELTNEALEGYWKLTHLNGAELHNETMLYINFSPETQRYEMWDNIGSMYLCQTTGTYQIIKEEDDTYTLRGTYDNGVGDWNEEYMVELYENDRMQWWSRTTGTCLEFKFAIEVPEEFYK